MATITINGKTFEVEGDNIYIHTRGSAIKLCGNVVGYNYSGEVSLKIEGAVANIDAGGSVECDNVSGDIDAGGSVNCGNVGGSVNAGGPVFVYPVLDRNE